MAGVTLFAGRYVDRDEAHVRALAHQRGYVVRCDDPLGDPVGAIAVIDPRTGETLTAALCWSHIAGWFEHGDVEPAADVPF